MIEKLGWGKDMQQLIDGYSTKSIVQGLIEELILSLGKMKISDDK